MVLMDIRPLFHHSSAPILRQLDEGHYVQASKGLSRRQLGQFFESELVVGVDADAGSHAHRFLGNHSGIQLGMLH
jgi:hypothetical protein